MQNTDLSPAPLTLSALSLQSNVEPTFWALVVYDLHCALALEVASATRQSCCKQGWGLCQSPCGWEPAVESLLQEENLCSYLK